jgi:predicted DNA-binding transcriptional regulator AlpA
MSIDTGKDETWLTGPQIARRFGISSMSLWRWLNDPKLAFPRPTQIRERNYWRLGDIVAWERRAAASTAKRASAKAEVA